MKSRVKPQVEHARECLDQGDLISAWKALDAHLAVHTDDAEALVLIAQLQVLLGRTEEAAGVLDLVLESCPDDATAAVQRARIAADAGDWALAEKWYAQAAGGGVPRSHAPARDQWMSEWADVLTRLGRHGDAIDVATALCDSAPADVQSWFWLGVARQRAGQHEGALFAYQRAARLNPEHPLLCNNMAMACVELGAHERAQPLLERGLRADPGNPLLWSNLAAVLLEHGEVTASRIAAERACTLAPHDAGACHAYARVLAALGRWQAARNAAERAIALDPSSHVLRWTLAQLQLQQGDYVSGWQNFAARWYGSRECREQAPALVMPRWDEEPLASRTLLVLPEPSLRDTLLFLRFVPALSRHVREMGGNLIVACPPALRPLAMRSMASAAERFMDANEIDRVAADCSLPLGDVPRVLGATLDEVPLSGGYLQTDASVVRAWAARLSTDVRRLRVGLAWRDDATTSRDPLRSIDAVQLAQALAPLTHIEFVNLQDDADEQAQAMREAGLPIVDPMPEVRTLDDTAALIQLVDIVIAVDAATAQLAGALGVQTWVLLDANPHWVWMIGREDSPWYAAARLFRQPQHGRWASVLNDVQRALAAIAETDLNALATHSPPPSNRLPGELDQEKRHPTTTTTTPS